jgi:uncharacterized protein (TIGR03546 family)
MLTRSIGKVIRGKATPLQLSLACILGSMLGFLPGYKDGGVFLHAPGLLLSLLILLVVLNANLTLAALTGMIAKLAALALMPLSFRIGVELLEGPAQGLFKTAINAPVLAYFGFEYYATTGGLVLGLVFGILAAVLVTTLIKTYRRRMSKLEEGSERYQKYASKRWVRVLSWVLIGGGKGKKSYSDLLDKRIGNPVRPIGIIVALLLVGLVYIVQAFFRDDIVTAATKRGLEKANGATVDIGKAHLDLKNGQLLVTGLAMADASKLDTDLFRATTLEATVDTSDLLRKRITLSRVTSADSSTGAKRATPGHLIGTPVPPPPPPPGEKTIDDYIKDAQKWKERLQQARRWLDEINRKREQTTEPTQPGQKPETARERLARLAREQGWARVAATHLVDKAPSLLIRELAIDGLKTPPLPGQAKPDVLDVHATNLSTQPWLVAQAPQVTVKSRAGTLDFAAALGGVAGTRADSTLSIAYRGLPSDLIGEQLKFNGEQPLKGGTMDISARGTLTPANAINLPLEVTMHNTTISLPGAGSQQLAQLVMPIGVQGPLDNPRIIFDQNAFADALTKAGATALADKARGEAQRAVDKATDKAMKQLDDKLEKKLGDKLGDKAPAGLGDQLKGGLGNLIPGQKKDAPEPKKKP